MPSTYTNSNRFEKPGVFEQDSTWGVTANVDFDLIDAAISGIIAVALPDTDYTLTVANGAADQSRPMGINFSGTLTAPRTITAPAVTKAYIIYNTTTQILNIITSAIGSTPCAIAPGLRCLIATGSGGGTFNIVASNSGDATTLNGQPASFYQNASNMNSGTLPSARLAAGTTGVAGILQLTDSVSSTSITTAATPNSVKTANDNATSASTTANNALSVANTASGTATSANNTSNTALGNANSALTTANGAQTTANNAQSAAATAQTTANNANASIGARTSPNLPAFCYKAASNQTSGTTIVFATAVFTQQGTGYSTGTNLFTAPTTGMYSFSVSLAVNNGTGTNQNFSAQFSVNGVGIAGSTTIVLPSTTGALVFSAALRLTAADTVGIVTTGPGLSGVFPVLSGISTYFSGCFLG